MIFQDRREAGRILALGLGDTPIGPMLSCWRSRAAACRWRSRWLAHSTFRSMYSWFASWVCQDMRNWQWAQSLAAVLGF